MNIESNGKARCKARTSVALGVASIVLALVQIPKLQRIEWAPFVILGLWLMSLICGVSGSGLAWRVRRGKQEDTDKRVIKLVNAGFLLNTIGCVCVLIFLKITLTPRISVDYSTIPNNLLP